MFELKSFTWIPPSYLDKPLSSLVDWLSLSGLKHFDRDGFGLSNVEQAFCAFHGYNTQRQIDAVSLGTSWYEQKGLEDGLVLDHAFLFSRPEFVGEAREQLEELVPSYPILARLLSVQKKFGLDFSLDYIWETSAIEVFHVEVDHYDTDGWSFTKEKLEELIGKVDWVDFAKWLLSHKDEWRNLNSDEQSDYRCRQLGWPQTYNTLKAYRTL